MAPASVLPLNLASISYTLNAARARAKMSIENMRSGRRDFMKCSLAWLGAGMATLAAGCGRNRAELEIQSAAPSPTLRRIPSPTPRPLHEAMFYRTLDDGRVQCQICFRTCIVPDGKLGFCKNKKNVGGRYYSLIYGRPLALHPDPIEKEPVFHMLPGSQIFCTGTASCNQRCQFCQNWEMSQRTLWEVQNLDAMPEEVVAMALEAGCQAVSFTYNEPTVFYEQMYDTARLAKQAGLRALFHTNGTMNPKPLLALLEHMDAIVVDLKAFTPEFYERVCSSELAPVLRTLRTIAEASVHLEIVHLIIPTKNDDLEQTRRMCDWIVQTVGERVPLHLNRFFPAYKLKRLPPTPIETLEAAAAAADEAGLQYVYIGNLPGHVRNSTFCPTCGRVLIDRVHFVVLENHLRQGRCPDCGERIPGIWS